MKTSVLALFLCASVSVAQQITGSITGTVTDPTGASVSGVAVKLTNSGTGVVQSTATNSSGDFRFLLLPSGIYSLDATMSGFKTFRREGIVVEVDRSVAVPVGLQVGQVSDTVEVDGGSTLLDTNTSSLGTVMDGKTVVDLPLNGSNPMAMANMAHSVKANGNFDD